MKGIIAPQYLVITKQLENAIKVADKLLSIKNATAKIKGNKKGCLSTICKKTSGIKYVI
ncbi:hypothetical protein Q0N71_27760 [Bacillus thuringiensis]